MLVLVLVTDLMQELALHLVLMSVLVILLVPDLMQALALHLVLMSV